MNSPWLPKEQVFMHVYSFVCACVNSIDVVMFFTDPATLFNYTAVIQWKNTLTWVQRLNTAQHLHNNKRLALTPRGYIVFIKITIWFMLYLIMKTEGSLTRACKTTEHCLVISGGADQMVIVCIFNTYIFWAVGIYRDRETKLCRKNKEWHEFCSTYF